MKRNGFFVCAATLMIVLLQGCGEPARQDTRQIDQLACTGMRFYGDSIVRYFHDDGSEYITRQTQELCALDRGFLVKAREPEGMFVWKLTGDQFLTSPDTPRSRELLSRLQARAISTSLLAGAGIIGKSGGVSLEPVSLAGQWYLPVEVTDPAALWVRETLYFNRTSSKVDLVRVEDIATGEVVSTRVFNYGYIDELADPVPMKIEVYSTDVSSIDPAKIMDITYASLKLSVLD